MKFRAGNTVTVFPGMRAFVFTHHLHGFFGNGAHFTGAFFLFHVQHRPDVQGADRGMRIESTCCPMFMKNIRQAPGILGKVFQSHGTVFNKGNRFTVAFHRHHDIQAGFTYFPDGILKFIVSGLDHCIRETQVRHQLHQPSQTF